MYCSLTDADVCVRLLCVCAVVSSQLFVACSMEETFWYSSDEKLGLVLERGYELI